MTSELQKDYIIAMTLQERENALKSKTPTNLRSGRSGHCGVNSGKNSARYGDPEQDSSHLRSGRSGHAGLTVKRKEKEEIDIDYEEIEEQAKKDVEELKNREVPHPSMRSGRSGHCGVQSGKKKPGETQEHLDPSTLRSGRSGHSGLTVKRVEESIELDLETIEEQARKDAEELKNREVPHPTLRTGRSGHCGVQSGKVKAAEGQEHLDPSTLRSGRSGHAGLTPVKKKK